MKEDRLINFGLALVFVLQFIWHMPGTIALRNTLLVLFFLVTLVLLFLTRHMFWARVRLPIGPEVLLLMLTIWIATVNFFWADRPALSWKEFGPQWILPISCGIFGWLFAQAAMLRRQNFVINLVKLIFIAYFIQVFLHDLMSLWFYFERGYIAFRNAPVLDIPAMIEKIGYLTSLSDGFSGQNPGFFSYPNAILSALIVAEVCQRLLIGTRMLPFGNYFLGFSLFLVVACNYTLRMRNGNVGLLLLLIFAGIVLLLKLGAKKRIKTTLLYSLVFFSSIASMGYVFFKSDQRWLGFIETVEFGWKTKEDNAWLNIPPLPVMPNGQVVEESAYSRITMLKEGLSQIAERPLGSGYDRNAYGGRITDRYHLPEETRGAHAHSGVIDFAIGTGIPGILLWLGFMCSLTLLGIRAVKADAVGSGLMLIFLASGFFGRIMVDSVMRDHFLQVFMFLSGWFLSVCYPPRRDKKPDL